MIWIKGVSGWTFITSATGGVGVEFVAVSGGAIYLADPAGKPQTFHYGGLGVGVTAGAKLPKIGKINFAIKGKGVGAAVAPAAFPNAGRIYITDAFKGSELALSDLQGGTAFVEAGAGLFAGVSGAAMLLGINPLRLAACLTTLGAPFLYSTLMSAPAVLVSAGLNVGLQAGAGVAGFVGYLR